MIEVTPTDDNTFEVTVKDADGSSTHTVTVDDEYYETLAGGEISREELVRRSFEFLLEREPRQSILPRFELRVITRYFPSYEEEIRL